MFNANSDFTLLEVKREKRDKKDILNIFLNNSKDGNWNKGYNETFIVGKTPKEALKELNDIIMKNEEKNDNMETPSRKTDTCVII